MSAAPITIKLRCKSWPQLQRIYTRDLSRGGLFLKATQLPEIGRAMRIDLVLPSESIVSLQGIVAEHVAPGGLDGRGPGIDVSLQTIPQRTLWLIEQALESRTGHAGAQAGTVAPAASDDARAEAGSEDNSIEGGAQVADAEGELVAALRSEYESLRQLNPFQVLGIDYDTTDAAVRAAFGELTRRYHPDRYARYQSKEARRYASEIFILVRDAYRELGGPRQRERTLLAIRNRSRSRAPAGPRAGTAPPSTTTSAPPAARTATATATATATRTQPTAPQLSAAPERAMPPLTSYPKAEAHLEAGEFAAALNVYRTASRSDPADRGARLGVELVEGLKALQQRDRLEAAQRFEAVLELDPGNERAARELAEMRRFATNERKGFLARLLGKKV